MEWVFWGKLDVERGSNVWKQDQIHGLESGSEPESERGKHGT